MSVSSWKDLGQSPIRDALLLAEVAALLHDVGKCADEHIINQASDKPQDYSYSYKTAQSHRLPLGLPDVCLMNETVSVKDMIEQGMPRVIRDTSKPWLLRVLGRCHLAAHVEKELFDKETSTKQPQNNTRLSTAFGLEGNPVTGLTNTLSSLPFNSMQSRATFVPQVERAFGAALGDTRRPINEVTLADWSGAVASLYKSALAGALLGVKPTNPDHLRWRLLRVNFDVLALYAKAVKIADLLGYQRAVDEACEAVKKLIEEEYPLGNEIYRDSTGIYFTFPDLDLPADLAQEIRRRVEEVEMGLAPRVAVTVGDGATADEQLKCVLGKARRKALQDLVQPFDSQNLNACWQQQWTTVGEGKWELCPVCRLRPKREEDEVCEACEKRRRSRIKTWEKNPRQTIWMDEIADHNDRVALVVGKFGLDDWLSGDLVQTMLVKVEPNNPGGCTPKNPSPARLRRVWETCQRFWTETVVKDILQRYPFGAGDVLRCTRLVIVPDDTQGWQENVPYDGTINGKAVSLLWLQNEGRFVTISNLQLGVAQAKDETAVEQEWHGGRCTVALPDKPARRRTFTIQRVDLLRGENIRNYVPYLTLLASPDQLLALIPAAQALGIAEKIRSEYERQMGKVQNHLPLFLGLVFFQRKLPLTAVMDTARRMLDQVKLAEETWQVECNRPSEDSQKRYLRLSRGQACIVYEVPVKMGDNQTHDLWYPYFFFQGDPAGRPLCFQHKSNGKHNGRWLIHVKDLREGDTAFVIPSRFAYLFLESTAQRFRFDPQQDVMLLGELTRLTEMWKAVCESPEMSDTKLQAIHALFESKLREWQLGEPTSVHPITDETFRHLVENTLRRDNVQGITVEDVLNGRFRRCIDLYLHILKRRVSNEKRKQEEKHEQRTV